MHPENVSALMVDAEKSYQTDVKLIKNSLRLKFQPIAYFAMCAREI